MAKLVDSGNNQYGIKGVFTWAAANRDEDFHEEFPFVSNVWVRLNPNRTSGTGSVDVTLDFLLNSQWVEMSTINASAATVATIARVNLMSGNPIQFGTPLRARLNFATSSYIGTIAYEVRY